MVMPNQLTRPATAAVGAVVLLTAAAALAQLPSAEQAAYNAVDDAVSAFRSASGRDEMTRVAGRILDAAERALNAFNAASRARAAAIARAGAAARWANAVMVDCENFNCDNGRLIYFDGVEDARARSYEADSAVSAAIASYVEAVGIAGAAEARERAALFRRFANRMRGLRGNSRDMRRRRNELIREADTEIDSLDALYSRAEAARYAANRAALDALGRAGRTLSTAAWLLGTDGYYPAMRAAEVTREAAALDRAVAAAADPDVSNDSEATHRALDALLIAARGTFIVLESHVQLVEAEQGAYNAVDDAVSAFRSASGRDEMTRAAGRILDAAERALNAFNAADRARDAAYARYYAAVQHLRAIAVICANGYCGDDGLIVDGLEDAYARQFEALSALSAANASYVDAVGIAGASEARARAARFRGFANRMRGLRGNSSDMRRRRNELHRQVTAETNFLADLYDRARAAHYAANRAALDALGRAGRTLSTAAGRLTDGYYPATRAAEVTREAAALDRAVAAAADPEVSNASDATDRALDDLILAAREVYVVLESHVGLVEQAAREHERDPEPELPGQADVERRSDVESEPAGDFAGWVRQINAAVAAAERAADEAERAAAGAGNWFSRSSACINAEGRVSQAINRVQGLTVGGRRPGFVPAAGGSQAWDELRERLVEAGERARAACSSIEPPAC